MRLLKTIYPHEVDPTSPEFDYTSFTPRPAARAIIFNGQKVALIHVKNDGYYMLPGGGIDGDEDHPVALAREVREELGCEIRVGDEIGTITTFIDRWRNKQIDYCYVAFLNGSSLRRQLTDFEAKAGYELVWVPNIDAALKLVRQAKPVARDGLLIRERDATFLESVRICNHVPKRS